MPLPLVLPRHRRVRVVAGALGALAFLGLVPAPAPAQSARAEREEVRREQAQVAREVDALSADQAQVTDALVALEANVAAQQQAAATAAEVADASATRAAEARAAAEVQALELMGLQQRLKQFAVSAYVDPPADELLRRLEAGSAQEDATRRALLTMRTGRDVDVIDQVRVAQRRLDEEVRRAEAARVDAEADAVAAERAVASLTAARDEQAAFAAALRARLDQRLSDAAALEELDAELARTIREEEAAVAAALARLAPPPPPPPPPAPSDPGPTNPAPAPTAPPTQGGGAPAPAPAPSPAPTSPPTTSAPRPSPSAPALRTVGGITVAASIADNVAALLDAARSAGISLGGSGYRSSESQIALRRQNCGTSQYAIWDMPPDLCSPPTARPGMSNHERGLAIDFTANGRFITSRSDPGFVWLAANAARYGLFNLPSEPWHWSTSGG
ncbi:M15 family metallopeptidase [Rhabdothermincola salaria]|uniref:M15 family metallopeptidase n=1 Tax=Rhabdothermincola salaria TaxID=2903142 RepID=UPI001E3B268B|nr:M15 family metallopeptidase [Rhabdothermincola salaria]MCD9624427.1 M15 family metallopeptidase [Rhabdothermincola salaria]